MIQVPDKHRNKRLKLALKKRCSRRSQFAFTLIEIVVVVSVLGILAMVSIPNYVKSRGSATKSTCLRNQTVMEHAVQEWAFMTGKSMNDAYLLTDPELLSYFMSSRLPECPSGGTYTPGGTTSEAPNCSVEDHEP